MAAAFLSLFVLGALVAIGLALGIFIFYNWDRINDFI
jgi:hypothetical protein